ncbi:MAG TPA: hypothetical protein VFH85_07670 [Gammaproteobacteria bacterium]|nr:hypothetical protein [Gammaproteobacteria bacterium]
MTRKDYELIAAAIRSALPTALVAADLPLLNQAHGNTALRLAAALASDNPRFDRARFLKACGVQS